MGAAASTPGGGALSVNEIASAMRAAGWPEDAIPVGITVALAESGGNPRAVNRANRNGSVDYGLFQINTVHGSLLSRGDKFNPVDNARMALTVYKQAGNSWKPWSTYNAKSNVKYESAVQLGLIDDINKGLITGIAGTAAGMKQAGDVVTSATTGVGQVMETLTSPVLWKRLLLVLLAIFLIIVGTVVLLRKPLMEGGVKLATKGLIDTKGLV